MLHHTIRAAAVFLAVLAIRPAAGQGPADPLAAIVARVGDEVITGADFQRDLQNRVKLEQARLAKIITPDAEFRRATLQERVNALVLRVLVRNAGIEVAEAEVQADYERHRRTLPSDADYERYMQVNGLDHEGVLDAIRAKLQTDRFIAQETSGITVDEEEMKSLYTRWADAEMTTRPEPSVTFGHIFVLTLPGKAGEDDVSKQRAQDAYDRIQSGEDFATVAREISDDSDSAELGGIRRDVPISYLPSELSAALAKMEPGEMSPPIEGRYGWHVVRMDATHAAGEASFEELRGRIHDLLLQDKKAKKIKAILNGAGTVLRIEMHEDIALRVPLVAREDPAPTESS